MSVTSTPQDTVGRTLATAAVSTRFFERTRIFRGQSAVFLGDALAYHATGLTFNPLGVTATVRNYTLEDVVLDADSMILFKQRHAISETAYFNSPNAVTYLPDQTELTLVPDNEDLVLGYNNAHWGYQHWLTQCIPAIDWSLRQKRTRDVRLILPNLEHWQADLLALLGYDHVPRLTLRAGMHYRLPRIEYSDFLSGTTSFAICLSALETAKRIANAVPSFASSARILYVDEVNPYYGSIYNEGAVIDLLRRHGVTIVERGRLRTAERINLFRNADVVIGPLGQGLSDVLFCRPGTLLWEWMPSHHQNASFNRLAQAAQVDYWGDLFEAVTEPVKPGQWAVDLDLVAKRLADISARIADRTIIGTTPVNDCGNVTKSLGSRPIDELMLGFESLGDNCEFGLVQRHAGVEPLGLLRFNGFHTPPEFRLGKLVAALENRFDGLGAPGTISVFPDGVPGRRELIVHESAYEFWYHTGIPEGTIELGTQTGHETTRLGFLRRKLLEDLESGDKIWVWKSQATTHWEQVQPLLAILRRYGPNTLLWIVETDDEHPAGTMEPLEADFIKGYVARFAPYEAVADIHFASWFEVCSRADEFRHPDQATMKPEDEAGPPARPLSAMEFLARHQASTPHIVSAAPKASRLRRWFRIR